MVSRWVCSLAVLSLFSGEAVADTRSHAFYARGLPAFHTGLWEEAYRQFDAAVRADPNDALALYYRGLTQARRGSTSLAIEDIEKALALRSDLPQAALDLGIAYFDAGRFTQARKWLSAAHNAPAERRTAALFLGIIELRRKSYRPAVRYFEDAESDPELSQAAHYYAALALLGLQQVQTARLELSEASRIQPETEIGRIAARDANRTDLGRGEVVRVTTDLPEAPWSLSAGARLGYDSNVNLGPSDGAADKDEADDGFLALAASGRYTLSDSPVARVTADAAVYQSVHFDSRKFDLTTVRPRLAASAALDRFQLGGALAYEYDALDYDGFSQEITTLPWVAFAETPNTATQLYYRFRYRDYLSRPFDPFRDGINNAIGVRQSVRWGEGRYSFIGGYRFDLEDPEDTGADDEALKNGARDFEYRGHQLDFAFQARVAAALLALGMPSSHPVEHARFRAAYAVRLEDYEFRNSRTKTATFGGFRRHDVDHRFAFAVESEIVPALRLELALVGVANASNLSEFDATRVLGFVGVHYGL